MTEIVAEIHAALDWLAEHGPAHGIAGPIVLSGWSAGGHLTAMCLGSSERRRWTGDLRPVRAGTDPRHLSEREAATDRCGDRCAVAAATAGGAQAAGDRLWHGGTAAAGVRQPRPACDACGRACAGSLMPVPGRITSPSCTNCAMRMGS